MTELSAKELCDIIRSCRKNGVSTFKFQGLALEFGDQSKIKDKAVVPKAVEDDAGDYEPDLDQMMVEDPVAYEKFLSENMDEQEDS